MQIKEFIIDKTEALKKAIERKKEENDRNFEREVDLTLRSSAGGTEDIIDAIVTVSWTDAQGEHSVSSATEFTKWREISAGGCPTPTPEP